MFWTPVMSHRAANSEFTNRSHHRVFTTSSWAWWWCGGGEGGGGGGLTTLRSFSKHSDPPTLFARHCLSRSETVQTLGHQVDSTVLDAAQRQKPRPPHNADRRHQQREDDVGCANTPSFLLSRSTNGSREDTASQRPTDARAAAAAANTDKAGMLLPGLQVRLCTPDRHDYTIYRYRQDM